MMAIALLLVAGIGIAPVESFNCTVGVSSPPADYTSLIAAINSGCTNIEFISDVSESFSATQAVTLPAGNVFVDGQGFRWIVSAPVSPTIEVTSAWYDLTFNNLNMELTFPNPTTDFLMMRDTNLILDTVTLQMTGPDPIFVVNDASGFGLTVRNSFISSSGGGRFAALDVFLPPAPVIDVSTTTFQSLEWGFLLSTSIPEPTFMSFDRSQFSGIQLFAIGASATDSVIDLDVFWTSFDSIDVPIDLYAFNSFLDVSMDSSTILWYTTAGFAADLTVSTMNMEFIDSEISGGFDPFASIGALFNLNGPDTTVDLDIFGGLFMYPGARGIQFQFTDPTGGKQVYLSAQGLYIEQSMVGIGFNTGPDIWTPSPPTVPSAVIDAIIADYYGYANVRSNINITDFVNSLVTLWIEEGFMTSSDTAHVYMDNVGLGSDVELMFLDSQLEWVFMGSAVDFTAGPGPVNLDVGLTSTQISDITWNGLDLNFPSDANVNVNLFDSFITLTTVGIMTLFASGTSTLQMSLAETDISRNTGSGVVVAGLPGSFTDARVEVVDSSIYLNRGRGVSMNIEGSSEMVIQDSWIASNVLDGVRIRSLRSLEVSRSMFYNNSFDSSLGADLWLLHDTAMPSVDVLIQDAFFSDTDVGVFLDKSGSGPLTMDILDTWMDNMRDNDVSINLDGPGENDLIYMEDFLSLSTPAEPNVAVSSSDPESGDDLITVNSYFRDFYLFGNIYGLILETAFNEFMSGVDGGAAAFIAWTLAVRVVSESTGLPLRNVEFRWWNESQSLGITRTDGSGFTGFTYAYWFDSTDPMLDNIEFSWAGGRYNYYSDYSSLVIRTAYPSLPHSNQFTMPGWLSYIEFNHTLLSISALGFSRALGTTILTINGEIGFFMGYFSDHPYGDFPVTAGPGSDNLVDGAKLINPPPGGVKIPLRIVSFAASENLVIINAMVLYNGFWQPTVIYIDVNKRLVWSPGPIDFRGWV